MSLDPITTLGVELKREIPKGQALADWIQTDTGYAEAVAALEHGGYYGNRLARAVFDLSRGAIRLPLTFDSLDQLDEAVGA